MVTTNTSPFGSPSRTEVLKYLRLLGESFPRELARLTGIRLSAIQKALSSLERDGLVAGRTVGRMRMFTLNPGFFAVRELEALLARLASSDSEATQTAARLRRRPRRTGKPLS
jgi:DNA-binding transcriptional ArsR family regulator